MDALLIRQKISEHNCSLVLIPIINGVAVRDGITSGWKKQLLKFAKKRNYNVVECWSTVLNSHFEIEEAQKAYNESK